MKNELEACLQNYSPQTQKIMEIMAINISPIGYNDVTRIASFYGFKSQDVKLIFKELKKNEFPIIYKQGYGYIQSYELDKAFSMILLAELVHSGKYSESSCATIACQKAYSNTVSLKLMKFLLGKDIAQFSLYELDDDDYLEAIHTAITMDSYLGLERILPTAYLCTFFQSYVYSQVSYLNDLKPIDDLYHRLMTYGIDASTNSTLRMTYGIVEILLKGEIDKIPEYVDFASDDGCYLMGMYHLYKGDYDLAAKSFEQGLKLAKTSSDDILPRLSLFSFCYVMSLILSSTPKLIKRQTVLLNKKAIVNYPNYFPAYLALKKKIEGDKQVYFDAEFLAYLSLDRLAGLLYTCILKHYNSDDYTKNELYDLIHKIDPKSYQLVALEIFSHFSEFQTQYDLLVKEIGVTGVLARDKVLENWERELNKLLVDGLAVSDVSEKKEKKLSRICYHVSPQNCYIQPILQTSSNSGKTWTKGRSIALKTFQGSEMMSSMTEKDVQISKCIVSHYGWSGVDYQISSDASKYLVGHSNVYLYTNPDVAVEVVAIKPEIVISVAKNGYKISSNVSKIDVPNQIIQESPTRLAVLNLSLKDCETLRILSNIKHLPFEAKEKLILLLKQLNNTMTVYSDLIDNGAVIRKITSDSRIVVQLSPVGEVIKALFYVKPFTSTSPYCKVGVGAKSVMGLVGGEKLQAIRNLEEEQSNMEKLTSLIEPFSEINEGTSLYDTPESALQLVEVLSAHSGVFMTEWPEGEKYKVVANVDSDALKLSLKSQNNWFDIEGELQISEEQLISIKTLLEMMQNSNGRFVPIGKNEFIALSEKLKKQLTEIDSVAIVSKENVTVNKYAISVLKDLKDEGCKIKTDRQFKELEKKIERAEFLEIDVPRGLKAELREYQNKGFQWMARLAEWGAGGCLADDMGLGKTVQSIAMLLRMAEGGTSLVVCPASVLPNWERELSKFAPSLNCMTLNSASNRAELIQNTASYDVVLSTYGLLVTEHELFSEKEWQMVILDEAHTIKNKETKTSKSTMNLAAKFRLILTGTPIQNHLGEIWNLFNFINPGLLGSADEFMRKYIVPIVQNKDKICQNKLKRLMSPFLLRRTKSGVLDELPSKTEIVYRIEMSDSEKAFYELYRRKAEAMLQESLPSERIKVLAEITKLRMAACNISLVDKNFDFPSSKLEQFAQIVEELQQGSHTALVFSQFTSHLALIKEYLDGTDIRYLYFDGSTSIKERERLVAEFQKGAYTLFLISLKAGGLGLNLTAADYVIHMDPWWNPAIEDQATDRAYRIGQLRPVTVYRLIAKDTIEEKILRLHATKRDLADALLEGADVANVLSKEELLFLLQNR